MHSLRQGALSALALALGLAAGPAFTGCGLPAAPKPPSLNLPEPVKDLAASRAGDQVVLTWTMPKENTDQLLLKGNIATRVCRKETAKSACVAVAKLQLAPAAAGTFTDTLPPALAAGAPHPLTYLVELSNRNGRSAGPSNSAVVLAGEAPPPVTGLTAEMRKNGILLRWNPGPDAQELTRTAVRLRRKLLTPSAAKTDQGLLAPQPEPVEQNLLVAAGVLPGRALDRDIRFGATYEYRAQRVLRVTLDGKAMELPGALSPPLHIEAVDVFPPPVPAGLAAVANPAENGAERSIDLSWQPVSDASLTGYIVYRREAGQNWQRISPSQPVVAPSFHDANIQPGRTYHYCVSAIDQNGNESARSAETQETVPNP
jgi:hypothetical protein